jgi:hypothetical protein
LLLTHTKLISKASELINNTYRNNLIVDDLKGKNVVIEDSNTISAKMHFINFCVHTVGKMASTNANMPVDTQREKKQQHSKIKMNREDIYFPGIENELQSRYQLTQC